VRERELEDYLHRQIPLSRAMAVRVYEIGEREVTLRAPLAPNINHHETVFGGSAAALTILAAWSLLHLRLRTAGIAARLVIQRNTMDYEQPIAAEFAARAFLESEQQWHTFTATLARRGRARISVAALLEHNGVVAGRFSGQFVASVAAAGSARPPP
jgi:thioesterase domain-containing protein